jgi:hypothetical protein
MQLKPITAIVVLSLVVASLLASGCTTTVTPSPTATPTATPFATASIPTPMPQQDAADAINTYFRGKGDLVSPFNWTTDKSGRTVFTGVVNDGSNKLIPWSHKITFIVCKDRNDTKTVFSQEKTKAANQGYGGLSSGGTDTTWYGYMGDYISRTKEVYIMACQPNYPCGRDYFMTFEYDFVVSTDYMTKM